MPQRPPSATATGPRGEGEPPPSSLDPLAGGPASWPWWSAPLALVCGLVLAALGLLVVDVPAALLGVDINSGHLPPGIQIADTAVQDGAFVAAAILVAAMGARRIRPWFFGLTPTPLRRAVRLVLALYAGFLIFSVVWASVLHLHGKEKLLDQLGAGRNAGLLIASAALTCVVAPFCEEFLFRGYMFTALRNWRGPWPAAVITGMLFGAVHATSAPAVYLVPLAFLGFALCLLYWRTASLLPCIAAHSLNNAIAFGNLENWTFGQIALLAAGSLGLLAAAGLAARSAGLIARPPAPRSAPA